MGYHIFLPRMLRGLLRSLELRYESLASAEISPKTSKRNTLAALGTVTSPVVAETHMEKAIWFSNNWDQIVDIPTFQVGNQMSYVPFIGQFSLSPLISDSEVLVLMSVA